MFDDFFVRALFSASIMFDEMQKTRATAGVQYDEAQSQCRYALARFEEIRRAYIQTIKLYCINDSEFDAICERYNKARDAYVDALKLQRQKFDAYQLAKNNYDIARIELQREQVYVQTKYLIRESAISKEANVANG